MAHAFDDTLAPHEWPTGSGLGEPMMRSPRRKGVATTDTLVRSPAPLH